MRQPVSDPGEIEVWLEYSADKLHAFDVLLMAFLKVDSSSIRDPAMNFIWGLLHCGRWGRSGLRQQRSATATVSGCSSVNSFVTFLSFRGALSGAGCKTFVLIKSNPFSKKKTGDHSLRDSLGWWQFETPVRLADKSWLKVPLVDLLWNKNNIRWLKKYGL